MAKTGKPKEKYLSVNGIRLHYLDWGNCRLQPILLLHGFMGHAHVWDEFAQTFRAQYHVIALDQRGHGKVNGVMMGHIPYPIILQTLPVSSKFWT